MITTKRIVEMKTLVTYSEIRPRSSFVERKLAFALKDAIAEIEELRATLAKYNAEPALRRLEDQR